MNADTQVEAAGGSVPVYVSEPRETPTAAAIVVHEAFGVNAHIREVTDRLSALGYLALAPNLFHRAGIEEIPYDGLESAMGYVKNLNGPDILTDLDACLTYAFERGIEPSSVGTVGFCMGGTVTFFAATRRPLAASVTFYGGGVATSRWEGVPSMLDQAPSLGCPWLGLFGDEDRGIAVDDVESLREALRENPNEIDIVRYADAGHGFHCDARPDVYREAPAKDAWSRAVAWFGAHLAR
jgi:carboxymethylenebutenolidase